MMIEVPPENSGFLISRDFLNEIGEQLAFGAGPLLRRHNRMIINGLRYRPLYHPFITIEYSRIGSRSDD